MSKKIEMQVLVGDQYVTMHPVPAKHASSHATGSSDPISPSDIGAAPSNHMHDDRYYTETEIDTLLSGKSDTSHTHDDRYYTEIEVNNLLSGKSDTSHIHDDRYYTEGEVNSLLGGKQDASTAINTSNIGSQSVNYANSAGSATNATNATNAGNADTVDGCHVNLDPASAGIKLTYAGTGELASGSSGLTTGYIYL